MATADHQNARPLHVKALLDGRAGHEKQTKGVLQALAELTTLTVEFQQLPVQSIPSIGRDLLSYMKIILRPAAGASRSQLFDLIVGTGARTHLPMLISKKQQPAPTPKLVTCMSPGPILRQQLDLCFIPRHDRPAPAANVLTTTGPPCLVRYSPDHDPGHGLVLVGGIDRKSHVWQGDILCRQIETLVDDRHEIRWTIASSPRTPPETEAMLDALCSRQAKLTFFRVNQTGPGWVEEQYQRCREVWVTADSVSMIYEAVSAGCLVGVLPVAWNKTPNKFQDSINDLAALKRIVTYDSFKNGDRPDPSMPPLDEARHCAVEILKRWWPERLADDG